MSSRSIWGHFGVFRVGLGAFWGPFCRVWGHSGSLMAFGGILGYFWLVWGLLGSFPWGLGSLMSSWSIWGHSGVFRVGLGAFGVVSMVFGVTRGI